MFKYPTKCHHSFRKVMSRDIESGCTKFKEQCSFEKCIKYSCATSMILVIVFVLVTLGGFAAYEVICMADHNDICVLQEHKFGYVMLFGSIVLGFAVGCVCLCARIFGWGPSVRVYP